MIRALRRKFILIAMLSLLLTLALLCTAIGVGNRIAVTKRADRILSLLHQNDGGFPAPELPADPPEKRGVDRDGDARYSVHERRGLPRKQGGTVGRMFASHP